MYNYLTWDIYDNVKTQYTFTIYNERENKLKRILKNKT